jgi:hypothetical protein
MIKLMEIFKEWMLEKEVHMQPKKQATKLDPCKCKYKCKEQAQPNSKYCIANYTCQIRIKSWAD